MSTQTTHFGLKQWSEDDSVLVSEINENFSLIDRSMAQFPVVKTGSYTGTGVYGADNPNSLTFDCEPRLVLIYDAESCGIMPILHFTDSSGAYYRYSGSSYGYNTVAWSGRTVSWYCTYGGDALQGSTQSAGAANQMNAADRTYHYLYF